MSVVVLLLQPDFGLFCLLLRVLALLQRYLRLFSLLGLGPLLLGLFLLVRAGVEQVAGAVSLPVARLNVGVADDGQLILLRLRPLHLPAPLLLVALLPALRFLLQKNSPDVAGLRVEVNRG